MSADLAGDMTLGLPFFELLKDHRTRQVQPKNMTISNIENGSAVTTVRTANSIGNSVHRSDSPTIVLTG